MENVKQQTRFPNRDQRPRPIDRNPEAGAIDPSPSPADLEMIAQRIVGMAAELSQIRQRVWINQSNDKIAASAMELCARLEKERHAQALTLKSYEQIGAARHWENEAARLAVQVENLQSVIAERPWYSFQQITAGIFTAAILSAAGIVLVLSFVAP